MVTAANGDHRGSICSSGRNSRLSLSKFISYEWTLYDLYFNYKYLIYQFQKLIKPSFLVGGNKESVSISNMSITGGGAGGSNMLEHRGSKSKASIRSSPKYGLDCWGDADKPFANITTENNANAKSIALTVMQLY